MPSDQPTVAELVARARRGEASAFDELVRRHLRAAFAVALAVLGRPADAEDLAQDAFVTALEKLDDCREPARFSGWLLQIVRNRALHALDKRGRREGSRHVRPGSTSAGADGDDIAYIDAIAAGDANTPVLGDIVLRGHLLRALATLTSVQREVVLLHDLDGWTHAEIAEALGLTETNCRQHLFTARRALRAELDSHREVTHGTGT